MVVFTAMYGSRFLGRILRVLQSHMSRCPVEMCGDGLWIEKFGDRPRQIFGVRN